MGLLSPGEVQLPARGGFSLDVVKTLTQGELHGSRGKRRPQRQPPGTRTGAEGGGSTEPGQQKRLRHAPGVRLAISRFDARFYLPISYDVQGGEIATPPRASEPTVRVARTWGLLGRGPVGWLTDSGAGWLAGRRDGRRGSRRRVGRSRTPANDRTAGTVDFCDRGRRTGPWPARRPGRRQRSGSSLRCHQSGRFLRSKWAARRGSRPAASDGSA